MIAPVNIRPRERANSQAVGNLKDYLVRLVRPDGGREIVAETWLLSEARAFPALLDDDLGSRRSSARQRGVRHESVEAATGRVIYPDPETAKEVSPSQLPNTS